MTALETLLLAYLVNAAWQLPLIGLLALALLGCLRKPSPRLEYGIWLVATGLVALLPIAVVSGLSGPGRFAAETTGGGSVEAAAWLLRGLLLVAGGATVGRLIRLARAGWAGARLRRRTSLLFRREGVEIRKSPAELESAGPLLVGIFRPVILIPGFLAERENAPLLQAALAHELAHVERRDMLTHVATEVLLLPLALHPLTPWLRQKLDASRELACDAQATVDAIEYAKCLLAIARIAIEPARHLTALGVGSAHILERRIVALAAPRTRTLAGWERYGAVLLVLVACAVLSGAARSSYLWLASVPAPPPPAKYQPLPPPPPPPPGFKKVRH